VSKKKICFHLKYLFFLQFSCRFNSPARGDSTVRLTLPMPLHKIKQSDSRYYSDIFQDLDERDYGLMCCTSTDLWPNVILHSNKKANYNVTNFSQYTSYLKNLDFYQFFKDLTNALAFMTAILLHSNQRQVSATYFRVVRRRIRT